MIDTSAQTVLLAFAAFLSDCKALSLNAEDEKELTATEFNSFFYNTV